MKIGAFQELIRCHLRSGRALTQFHLSRWKGQTNHRALPRYTTNVFVTHLMWSLERTRVTPHPYRDWLVMAMILLTVKIAVRF